MATVELLRGDCLHMLQWLAPDSIDMVLADLPYGTTACKWDTRIPFEPLWEQLHRVVKPNAAMCMFGSEPFSSLMRISNLKRFKYDWVWMKSKVSGPANAKNKPLNRHEIISIFSEGVTVHACQTKNRMPYNPQGLLPLGKMKKNCAHSDRPTAFQKRKNAKLEYFQEFTNYPHTLLDFKSENKTVHPTQKPVALLEYLIKTYTKEGDTVLDPTMGSGSTGVACKNLGRNFIGIEQDDKYMAIAEQRIYGF